MCIFWIAGCHWLSSIANRHLNHLLTLCCEQSLFTPKSFKIWNPNWKPKQSIRSRFYFSVVGIGCSLKLILKLSLELSWQRAILEPIGGVQVFNHLNCRFNYNQLFVFSESLSVVWAKRRLSFELVLSNFGQSLAVPEELSKSSPVFTRFTPYRRRSIWSEFKKWFLDPKKSGLLSWKFQ